MRSVYASSLKGYCTPDMLWRFFRDGAAALQTAHAGGKALGAIDLDAVAIQDTHFLFPVAEVTGSPADDIWALASATFTLATGFVVFEGTLQTADTPVPSLRAPELEHLSDLLRQALAFRPEERPSAQCLLDESEKALQNLAKRHRPLRPRVVEERKTVLSDFDRHWPEAFLAFLLCLMLGATPARSQVSPDDRTSQLIAISVNLRQGGTDAWQTASKHLAEVQDSFTLMDEMRDSRHDCPLLPSRVACFGINRIVNEIKAGDMVQKTGKDFKDGNDSRFGYALIEKGVRAGATSRYPLAGRFGDQLFVAIPYDPDQPFGLSATVNGSRYVAEEGPHQDGTLFLYIPAEAGLGNGAEAWLELENSGSKDAAFILINDKRGNQ